MSKAKSQLVYDYIENKILLEEYKPGQKLPSESKLCAELQVSRVSVRSGVEKLIAIGLLKKEKNAGTYVSNLNDDNYLKILTPTLLHNIDYVEMLELRQALDVLSIELCMKNINEIAIIELSKLLEEMKQFKETNDFFWLDRKFHMTISKYSFNRLLNNINEIIWDVLEKTAKNQYHSIGNDERIEEHSKILSALINEDYDLARIYTKRHLTRTIKDVKGN